MKARGKIMTAVCIVLLGVLSALAFLVNPVFGDSSTLSGKIYFTGRGINLSNLDGSDVQKIVSSGAIAEIALDIPGGQVYWTAIQSPGPSIRRCNLNGSALEDIITTLPWCPGGIAVGGGKMYWTNWAKGTIKRSNLDGSDIEALITGWEYPWAIALDVVHDKIYWVSGKGPGKISRADLDGSSLEDLVTEGLSWPHGITLDLADGKMYWSDYIEDKIQRANLDGSEVEDVITGAQNPLVNYPVGIDLDVVGKKIYWADQIGAGKVQRANLDGSDYEVVVTGYPAYGIAILPPLQAGRLIGLEVVGPNEVAENSEAQYKAIAYYDNNSTRDVTDSAQWSIEPNTIATIDANGLLTTESIYKPEDITIYAKYTENENTVDAEKAVSVFAICPSGSALEFDGQNDYVDCGNDSSLDITDSITVGAWVKRPNFEKSSVIAGKTNGNSATAGYGLFSYTNGLEFNFYSRGWRRTRPRVTTTPNEWHYVVGTFDGNIAYLYVDGEQKASVGYVGTITAATGYSFHISFWRSGIPSYFNGTIDEVSIWNVALTQEQIQANMHMRPSSDEPNLVAYWDFDEGEGQIAYDMSGNGNDGYLGSDPCDVDDSDPVWVESDAPIGICTTQELIERNISGALEIKLNILEEIETALAKENATIDMLKELFWGREYGDLNKSDIVKAKQKIHSAMQHEEHSINALEKSIGKLEDSLSALGYEAND